MKQKFGFIGLGLIGGSLAKALRGYYPDSDIVAFDKSKENLALAISEGVINISCSSIDDNFSMCDFIFLCAPVSYNNAYLSRLYNYTWDGLILSDVGSVKTSIHEEVAGTVLEPYFIGGHPMAGSEKSGYINSKPHLMENAFFALTPSCLVSQEKIKCIEELISSIKALPVVLDYKEHDYVTGTISHLPHIIASSLVNFVKETDNDRELMKEMAAGGFRDITRIASSNPTMWQHICLANKENISEILTQYIGSLQAFKKEVDDADKDHLFQLFEGARNYRNSFSERSSGPIKKAFAVYCDIIDETGGIATIATILASNSLSIKNIGIVHNREFEEGVLRIEFYDEDSSTKAAALLEKYRYIVYQR